VGPSWGWWGYFWLPFGRSGEAAYLASWDKGCVLELTLFDVPDISAVSFYPNEGECLLPPNTKFVVLAESRVEEREAQTGEKFLVRIIPLQMMSPDATALIS
jgi:hypothetical protein